MKLLLIVALAGAGIYLRRHPDARRWLVATARAGAVLAGYTAPDYGSLQHQVLLGARRQRCVAVNGITRLPTAFRIAFAEADRAIVEPAEAAFFADVAQVLLADAQERDWVVDRVPRFHAHYDEHGRPGFPSVTAVAPGEHGTGRLAAVPSQSAPSARHQDEGTRPFEDGEVTEERSAGAAASSLRLREMGSTRVITLEPRTRQVAVGRSGRCEVLLDDPAVSHRHARLARCANGWTLVDAGSRNGTFVNDRAAATPTLLHAGDVVRFGPDLSFLVSA